MSIRRFWHGRDRTGVVALFSGGFTPREMGSFVCQADEEALHRANDSIDDYFEENSTESEVVEYDLHCPNLGVVDEAMRPSQIKIAGEVCRLGMYVFKAWDRNLWYKKMLAPTVPLRVPSHLAWRWSAGLVQFKVSFADIAELDLRNGIDEAELANRCEK